MKKVVIFGAGQIGRGFIGDICYHSGYQLVFVDVYTRLVEALNREKRYPLWILGAEKEEKIISNLKALNFGQTGEIAAEIAEADTVFTAVGANNLASVGPILAEGLRLKEKKNSDFYINTIICENLMESSKVLREAVLKHLEDEEADRLAAERAGFVESVVSRMVAQLSKKDRDENPLLVTVEPYDVLPVAKKQFRGSIPNIRGLRPVDDLFPHEELKLYIHNLAHAALAYSGYLAGCTYIWEALNDKSIARLLDSVLNEVKSALLIKHSFPRQEVENYINDLKARFNNRLLNDTVYRVARDPMRKLGSRERIAGAIKLCLEHEIVPSGVCSVAAKCLCYNYSEDPSAVELQEKIRDEGIDVILRNISGIDNPEIRDLITEQYKKEASDEGSRT